MSSGLNAKNIPQNELVTRLIEGIYQIKVPLNEDRSFTLGYVNCYLIKGKTGWWLIDTGWYGSHSFNSLRASLQQLNLDFNDLKTIILTHSHPDHYGMAGNIRQHAPQIQMYCHRWEADLIDSRYIKFSESRNDIALMLHKHGVPDSELLASASMPTLDKVTVSIPDHLLYGGEIISTGIFDLEVIWTPGHSPGHICLYEACNKLLFCGDHVLPTITPNVGYHVLSGDNPLGDYFCALGKLYNLEVNWVHPGHEYSFSDLRGRIDSIKEHHAQRQSSVLELVARNFNSSYEITSRLKWSLKIPWDEFPPLQKRAAITETIAHLEHLRWAGKINKITQDNQIRYILR